MKIFERHTYNKTYNKIINILFNSNHNKVLTSFYENNNSTSILHIHCTIFIEFTSQYMLQNYCKS